MDVEVHRFSEFDSLNENQIKITSLVSYNC